MFNELESIHKNAYMKKGISNDALIRRFVPYKYKDYTKDSLLCADCFSGGSVDMAVIGLIKDVQMKNDSSGRSMLVVKASDRNGTSFRINFIRINVKRIRPYIVSQINNEAIIMGAFQHDKIYGFSIFNPEISFDAVKALKVHPIYSSIKNISAASIKKHIEMMLKEQEQETVPDNLRSGFSEINHAFQMIHYPKTLDEALLGYRRLVLDELIYFKLRMISEERNRTSHFKLVNREVMDHAIASLPYALTNGQKKSVDSMIGIAAAGNRINALVQGDVGCGKTIIAILLMICCAENGFQSVLMAPTQILAEQHCAEIRKIVPAEEVVFIDGSMKKAERTKAEDLIRKGKAKYIVGTSALLTSDLPFEKFGLVIVDEEHRFGVCQRNALFNEETHVVTMSATPIPRSIALTIYGDGTDVYQITEKPAGRIPVKTYFDNGGRVKNFIYARLKEGGQAYVICPLKEEAEEGSVMENILSAEEAYKEYDSLFGKLGYRTGLVTGATKAADKERILDQFKNGEIHILISTTVIEVGVNVPNANVIAIYNAERFGLSTLHQLRGRVGRGKRASYCILVSDEPNNRIRTLCTTDDGFKVAEADLLERHSGDLFGLRQSGKNRFVEKVLEYPDIEKAAVQIADKMNFRSALAHIEKYDKIFG